MSAAFESAVARFRSDPEMARYDTTEDVGGCWNTAHRFAWYLHEEGVSYAFRRWRNLPGLRTAYHHNVEVDRNIVCWRHRQIDASADWPHIEPVESYGVQFGEPQPICVTCGMSGQPHACKGLVEDPWTAALMTLNRAERRRLERFGDMPFFRGQSRRHPANTEVALAPEGTP